MAFIFGEETCRPSFAHKSTPLITYGLRFPQACAQHVKNNFRCKRVFIIASRSLSASSSALDQLKAALSDCVVGVRIGVSSHTPIEECAEIINQMLLLRVDCIVTLGAGSITDCAKIVRFALANNIQTIGGLLTLSQQGKREETRFVPPTIALVCVPTSLAGGEYQAKAGAMNSQTHIKAMFQPRRDPDLIVLDPELCTFSPSHLWLSSGVRAVDHCIETLCSLRANSASDSSAMKGLSGLLEGLLEYQSTVSRSHSDQLSSISKLWPSIHQCQLSVCHAMQAVSHGVPFGASHGIGHQLGPLGVAHGDTSCILLPAVCHFNHLKGANVAKQAIVAANLQKMPFIVKLLPSERSGGGPLELADVLDLIFRRLGMPRTLAEVGIGRDKLDNIAENSLNDAWLAHNPLPILKKEQVMEILEIISS